jgi:hypothetical protein
MKSITRALAAIFIALSIIVSPGAAFAANLLSPGSDGGVCNDASTKTSAVCNQAGNKDNPLTGCPSKCGQGILYDVVNILTFLAGGAAIIMLIVGALRFATSGSDISNGARTDTDIENARRSIVTALVGLVIIITGRYLILFVLSKL